MPAIHARGIGEARRELTAITSRLRHLEPGLRTLLPGLLDRQRRWWLTGGDGTWAPNRPSKVAADAKSGRSTRVMRDTGRLERAATKLGAAGQIVESSDLFLLLGVTVPYAAPLAAVGRSALADPTSRDGDDLADRLADWILTNA